jgi:hypothetical protein
VYFFIFSNLSRINKADEVVNALFARVNILESTKSEIWQSWAP